MKPDYLSICNEHGDDPTAFKKVWCASCANKECANYGSAMQRRAENWRKDLFENPPKMPESDPRLEVIRKKNFEGRPPSQWQTNEVPPKTANTTPATPTTINYELITANTEPPKTDAWSSEPKTVPLGFVVTIKK